MYGICGILLLTVMKKLMDKSALVFILNLILYSAAEYLVNWIAELPLKYLPWTTART